MKNKEILGGIYTDVSKNFQRGILKDMSRTLKASMHDAGVVEIYRLENMYGEDKGTGYAGNVWDKDGVCPTLTTMQGGNREPMIVASRGRNKENPSDRTPGIEVEQRLEPNSEGLCNTLTSVQKDNLVLEPAVKIKQATQQGYAECKVGGDTCPTLTASEMGVHKIESQYRIRKLTPLECWKLMGFTEEAFFKAEQVNSNSQLYKQAGNSIVVDVLEAIFRKMIKEARK